MNRIAQKPYVSTKDMSDEEWWDFVREGELPDEPPVMMGTALLGVAFSLGIMVGSVIAIVVMGGLL